MAANDSLASAYDLVLSLNKTDDTTMHYALTQTGLGAATLDLTDPKAVNVTQFNVGFPTSLALNEYELYYPHGSNDVVDVSGSVWYRIVHPNPLKQGGDSVTLTLDVTWASGGSHAGPYLSVWTGTGLGDLTYLMATTQFVGANFKMPDEGTVWVKAVVHRSHIPVSWDVLVRCIPQLPGDWFDHATGLVTNTVPGIDYMSTLAYEPGGDTFSAMQVDPQWVESRNNYDRGFYAGGFIGGSEHSTDYPHNDSRAYACGWNWGRLALHHQDWWTQDFTVDGAVPGLCRSYTPYLNTDDTFVTNTDTNFQTQSQMFAGFGVDASNGDVPGIGATLYTTVKISFAQVLLQHEVIQSWRPYLNEVFPTGAVDYQYEAGYTQIASLTVEPIFVSQSNTQADPVTVQFWGTQVIPDQPTFGYWESSIPAGTGAGVYPTAQHFRSGEPGQLLGRSVLLGTITGGNASPEQAVPANWLVSNLSQDGPWPTTQRAAFVVTAVIKEQMDNINPIPTGTYPNVYDHSAVFYLKVRMTLQPPRLRFLYPEGIIDPLRMIQRDDELGVGLQRPRMNTPGSVNNASSLQYGKRLINKNPVGYR